MAKVAVIVLAAGRGERFGGDENKALAKLDGRPIFIRSLEHFINRDDVCQTLLVVSGADLEQVRTKYAANVGFMGVKVVEGGKERRDSVLAGLQALPEDADLVAVHDAVRPCVTHKMIDDVFAKAAEMGAAILAAPVTGTLKRVADSGDIETTVTREKLFEAQTPQVFRREMIVEAYQKAPAEAELEITDDAQLVELLGGKVAAVRSDATNIKITTKPDIILANAILKARPSDRPGRKLGAFEEAQW